MNIENLANKFKHVINELAFCQMDLSKKTYAEFVAQTYYFVKHSIPLIEKAVEHSKNKSFVLRCKEHINEELNHDLIALRDLESLGIDIKQFEEWEWTKNFYEYQYKLIEKDGELLLGYILALEGIAVYAMPLLSALEGCYGKKTTRFFRIHAEEDQNHLPLALEQVNQSEVKNEILRNMDHTINEYLVFIDQLKQVNKKENQEDLAA